MKCDERGNVWVTGPGGVWVISPEAEHLGVARVPEVVGNLAWGGPDWRTLFIAASTSHRHAADLGRSAPRTVCMR